jgi:hypothetical protein
MTTAIALARRADKAAANRAQAAAEHTATLACIKNQLAELQALAAGKLGHTGPVDFGHVGSAQHVAGKLGELLDFLKGTGEHAA